MNKYTLFLIALIITLFIALTAWLAHGLVTYVFDGGLASDSGGFVRDFREASK